MEKRRKIIEILFENFRTIKRKLMEAPLKNIDVTPAQGMVLHLIFKKEAMSIKNLARELQVTSSAATQLVDSLVKKGYLTREIAADDRRVLEIKLSKKAKEKINELEEKKIKHMIHLLSALSDEELDQYIKLNQKITNSIRHQ